MICASHIMTSRFVQVPPEEAVGRAIEQMLDQAAVMVVVVGADGRIQGQLPEAVMLRAAMDSHLRQDPISLHMVRQFAAVDLRAPVDLVLDQFVLHNLHGLVVVENGIIRGAIERSDLLRGVMGPSADPILSATPWSGDAVGL